MKVRWPRRRWGHEIRINRPDGTLDGHYITPARWWTETGALFAATRVRDTYRTEPLLVGLITLQVVDAGPFDRDAYLAALDANYAAGRPDRPTEHTKICPSCGKTLRWWKHPPDAVNPVGLWHHQTEDEENACAL